VPAVPVDPLIFNAKLAVIGTAANFSISEPDLAILALTANATSFTEIVFG
jgi:hypothetical protein